MPRELLDEVSLPRPCCFWSCKPLAEDSRDERSPSPPQDPLSGCSKADFVCLGFLLPWQFAWEHHRWESIHRGCTWEQHGLQGRMRGQTGPLCLTQAAGGFAL